MICPLKIANELSGLTARSGIESRRERSVNDGAIPSSGSGASNEDPGSDIASGEWTDSLAACGGDHRDLGPEYEAVAKTIRGARVRRLFDRRTQSPSPKRVPLKTVEKVPMGFRGNRCTGPVASSPISAGAAEVSKIVHDAAYPVHSNNSIRAGFSTGGRVAGSNGASAIDCWQLDRNSLT